MLEQPQIYRLMNGMDGVMIDRAKVGNVARGGFGAARDVFQAWFAAEGASTADVDAMLDELWAVLHGMASLYLDRSAAFDLERAQHARSLRPRVSFLNGSSEFTLVLLTFWMRCAAYRSNTARAILAT
jgi:hypothetical protein